MEEVWQVHQQIEGWQPPQQARRLAQHPGEASLLRKKAGEQEHAGEEEFPEVGEVLSGVGGRRGLRRARGGGTVAMEQAEGGEEGAESAEEHHQRHHAVEPLSRVLAQHRHAQQEYQPTEQQVDGGEEEKRIHRAQAGSKDSRGPVGLRADPAKGLRSATILSPAKEIGQG